MAPLPDSSNVETYGIPEEAEPSRPSEPKPSENAAKPATVPQEYQIQTGDTLWDICQKLLDNPWYWPKLWALNDYILNPHLIYPGNKLAFFSGSETAPPRLEIVDENSAKSAKSNEAPTLKEAPEEAAVETGAATEEALPSKGPEGIAFVGKKTVSVRLRTLAFIAEKDMDNSVVGEISHSGEAKMELWTGDRLYLKFVKKRRVSVGDKFYVISTVKKVSDPDAIFGSLGTLVKKKATVKVLAVRKDSVDAIILECEDGSRRGDKIIPYYPSVRTLTLHKTNRPIEGKIIEGENQQVLISNNDFVYLNLGKKHGIDDGLQLLVVRRGDGIFQGDDKSLPYVPVGNLLVVETNETTSTAYVMSERDSLSVGDRVRNE